MSASIMTHSGTTGRWRALSGASIWRSAATVWKSWLRCAISALFTAVTGTTTCAALYPLSGRESPSLLTSPSSAICPTAKNSFPLRGMAPLFWALPARATPMKSSNFCQSLRKNGARSYQVFGTAGVDEFNYGVHIAEALAGIMGSGFTSVRFMGRGQAGRKIFRNLLSRTHKRRQRCL